MRFNVVILLQVTLFNCIVITKCNNKTKTLSSTNDVRNARCVNFENIGRFMGRTVEVIENNRFGDLLHYNDSQCTLESKVKFVSRHILDGLIVHEELPETHWHDYKSFHNKIYTTIQHEMAALSKWRNNLRRVAQHNRDFLEGKQSYSLHLNRFGDLDVTEYFRKFLKLFPTFPLFDPAEDRHKTAYRRTLQDTIPKKVDWRAKGFRPLREEQHDCGACYAFAVTHALQAQLYKKHGNWGELSPQQIVDCSFKDGNKGCNGGSIRAALRYVARDGIVKESKYPYVGKEGACKYNVLQPRVRVRRWATLPAGDEAAIERSLATIGPLAVAVNGAPWTFQLYRSGIYDDLFCTSWTLNHAMLLVGYTPEYWILLNWWGKDWGEDGYIRIRRGLNRCGVTSLATYVEL